MPHLSIYERLKSIARTEQTINYSSIASLANLNMELQADRNEIGRILDDINRQEVSEDRPMLSVVVIREDKNYPGNGFFEIARQLGLHHGHNEIEDIEFFVKELKRVHAYWKAH